MQPIIKEIAAKKLVGKSIITSLAENRTAMLWQSFMPLRKEIKNTVSADLFSVEIYKDDYFKQFDIHKTFEKWAAIEVTDYAHLPERLEQLNLPGGLYALFIYKGESSNASAFFTKIFNEWLPSSGYVLDNSRPHFEVMGGKYKNNDPDSEEEIYIPVKQKQQ